MLPIRAVHLTIILFYICIIPSLVSATSPSGSSRGNISTSFPKKPLPDLNEKPPNEEQLDNFHRQNLPPGLTLINSSERQSSISSHLPESQTEMDKIQKKKGNSRLSSKKHYDSLPTEIKQARSRHITARHKARFNSWSEQEKEEFRAKQREAKRKHLLQPTSRQYKRLAPSKVRKINQNVESHTSSVNSDHQPSKHINGLPDLNEIPPDVPEEVQRSVLTSKRTTKQRVPPIESKGKKEGGKRGQLMNHTNENQMKAKNQGSKDRYQPELQISSNPPIRQTLPQKPLLPNLNEAPPNENASEGLQKGCKQTKKRKKHTISPVTSLPNATNIQNDPKRSAKRMKAVRFYASLTPERKKFRLQQISNLHKKRFENWSEEQKEEFRAKQREAKRKYNLKKKSQQS